MASPVSANEIFYKARQLTDNLQSDIQLATNRAEHVRASMRASEAEEIVRLLSEMFDDGK